MVEQTGKCNGKQTHNSITNQRDSLHEDPYHIVLLVFIHAFYTCVIQTYALVDTTPSFIKSFGFQESLGLLMLLNDVSYHVSQLLLSLVGDASGGGATTTQNERSAHLITTQSCCTDWETALILLLVFLLFLPELVHVLDAHLA